MGEKLDKLESFHPDRMASGSSAWATSSRLVEKAQEVIDQDEAREQAEKMFVGSFNLDDFLSLLGKIRGDGVDQGPPRHDPGTRPADGEHAHRRGRTSAVGSDHPLDDAATERYHPEVLNTTGASGSPQEPA